jgi:hypothetical protein
MESSLLGASVDGSFADEAPNVCVSAMKFMSVLDPEVMTALEHSMGSRAFRREELVPVLRRVIRDSLQRSQATAAASDVTKSAENFRQDLLRNSKFRDSEMREMIESIDTVGSDRITYSMIMEFFIEAARRAPRDGTSSDLTQRAGASNNSSRKQLNPSAVVVDSNVDYCLDEQQYEGTRANLVFVARHDCFLSCTSRWIERMTFANELIEGAPKIAMSPSDPSGTIATVEYAEPCDLIVVGLHNSKLIAFDYSSAERRRELQLADAPTSTLTVSCKSTLGLDESDETDEASSAAVSRIVTFCGTVNGQIFTIVETSGSTAWRLVASSRISTHPISCLAQIPGTELFVAVSGKIVAVFDSSDSTVKHMVSARSPISAALMHVPTSSLAFSCVGHSSILFFLPRRGLLHRGSEPLEIRRSRSGHKPTRSSAASKEDRVVRIVEDPSCTTSVVTVSEAGTLQLWNIAAQSPASLLRDGAECELHLPSSCLPLLYAVVEPNRAVSVLGGKSAYVVLSRMVEEDEGVDSPSAPGGEVRLENVLQVLDGGAHGAAGKKRDARSDEIVVVSPHHVRLYAAGSMSLVSSIPVTVSVGAASGERRLKRIIRDRVTCAALGPGRSLLLGTDQGTLLCLSLDPASLGNCNFLGRVLSPEPIAGLFFSPTRRVAGVVGEKGNIVTAEIAPHGGAVVDPSPSTAVAECSAWAADDELLVVAHVETSGKLRPVACLQILRIVSHGSRLLQAARHHFDTSVVKSFIGKSDVVVKVAIVRGESKFGGVFEAAEVDTLATVVVMLSCEDRSHVMTFAVKSDAKLASGTMEITFSLEPCKRLDLCEPDKIPVSLWCGPAASGVTFMFSFLDGSFGLADCSLSRESLVLVALPTREELITACCFHSGAKDFVLVGTSAIVSMSQLRRQADKPAQGSSADSKMDRHSRADLLPVSAACGLPQLRPALLSHQATSVIQMAGPSPHAGRNVRSAAPTARASPTQFPVPPRRIGSAAPGQVAALSSGTPQHGQITNARMANSTMKIRLPPLHVRK